MSNIYGWLIARDGQDVPGSYTFHTTEASALREAQEQSRCTNKPHNVYKVIQTHHVKAPLIVVEEVE